MQRSARTRFTLALVVMAAPAVACGAAAGQMVGHPIAGAVAGAIVRHERNKHKT